MVSDGPDTLAQKAAEAYVRGEHPVLLAAANYYGAVYETAV